MIPSPKEHFSYCMKNTVMRQAQGMTCVFGIKEFYYERIPTVVLLFTLFQGDAS